MGIVAIGLAFAIGWFMSAGVLPKISLISYRRRLFDLPSERKVHTSPIPRLGGVAFFPCIIVAVCIVVVCHNLLMERNLLDLELTTQLLALICSTFVLYLIGLMDDLVGLRPSQVPLPDAVRHSDCGVGAVLRQPARAVRHLQSACLCGRAFLGAGDSLHHQRLEPH